MTTKDDNRTITEQRAALHQLIEDAPAIIVTAWLHFLEDIKDAFTSRRQIDDASA